MFVFHLKPWWKGRAKLAVLLLDCLLFLKFYLFIYWLCWVVVAARSLPPVAASRGCSQLRWLLSLWSTGSGHIVALGLCCPEAPWDLPGPGIKPLSPALADKFLTIGPPRKSAAVINWKLTVSTAQASTWCGWNWGQWAQEREG